MILFYDQVCPAPYTYADLTTKPMGGSEASVLRIAAALLERGYTVTHRQKGDGQAMPDPGRVTHVITVRSPGHCVLMTEQYPKARHMLLLGDYSSPNDYKYTHLLAQAGVEVILVSEHHKDHWITTMRGHGVIQFPKVSRIYNPIDDDLVPRAEPNPNKLVFFSSPHKGLERTLQLFQLLRRQNPGFEISIANPGYYPLPKDLVGEGVRVLGPLPHPEVMREVSDALCVFYPNTVFPETFGIVFAEANALGVPVLAHAFGAAPEILYHPSEYMDTNNIPGVIEKVMAWHSGMRPRVRGKKEFRMSEVIRQWERRLK